MKLHEGAGCRVVYLFIFLTTCACVLTFYRLDSYLAGPSWYTVTETSPLSLSMPDGNCSCSVGNLPALGTNESNVATLSCHCNNSTADRYLRGGVGSVTLIQFQCPVNPPIEVEKACPPSVHTVETVEVEKACPPSSHVVETVEVEKACPPSSHVVETVEVEKACPPSLHTVERVEVAKPCPGVPWYAEGKTWHSPPKFPSCTMDACFNYSRCDNMTEPLVFTYDLPGPPQRSFEGFNKSKYWTDDPEKACLFFVFLDTKYPWPVKPYNLPHWNGGLNHVLITFADKWELRGPPSGSIGNASIMGTILYQTTSRPGFDIGIPLPGKVHLTELQSVHPMKRKYFATFRGTRYLGAHMDGAFRSFDSFREMHNGDDVIVVTTCNQITNNGLRSEHPELGVNCDEDGELHAKYEFTDLMNATFGLAPAGRQPASYRFIEVMSAGGIPVLITDNYVKPFETLIDWHECALEFPTSQMHRIIPALRALKEEDILRRQRNCLRIYNEFLKDDDTLTEASMRALKKRFMGVFPNFAQI
ncbi:hypothetical protein KC19_4G130700 [Ceratodon purpureus]|uniref:Exostosin GT47 domain-containing protein n=2 Tax=Ceratodon purpureus TaxID=3225 RepID=A0A8T0IBS9_CERPU|nr:hypothetical protein KC19_4G130700 [Ceratodon purpureus]